MPRSSASPAVAETPEDGPRGARTSGSGLARGGAREPDGRAFFVESFPPVVADGARVLILGSMPGEESLRRQQYYANPRNAFWRIMSDLLGVEPALGYDACLAVLGQRRVALWDVAHRCRRVLSADATLRDVEPNAIDAMLRRHASIAAVFCNGRAAEQLFRRLVWPDVAAHARHVYVGYLPSTSPAHAGMPFARKLRAWRAILDWL